MIVEARTEEEAIALANENPDWDVSIAETVNWKARDARLNE